MQVGQVSTGRCARKCAGVHTLSFLGDNSYAAKLHDCKLGTVHGKPACIQSHCSLMTSHSLAVL